MKVIIFFSITNQIEFIVDIETFYWMMDNNFIFMKVNNQ
jgi:hypothetical protein